VSAERDGLVAAIRDEPEADGPRQVWADWLEEHREGARAELVRVQCELARDEGDGPRLAALAARAEELIQTHAAEWLGPTTSFPNSARFERGTAVLRLVPEQFFAAADYQRLAPEWFPRAGVTGLELRRLGKSETPTPIDSLPALGLLSQLDLIGCHLGREGVGDLARSPHAAGLRSLLLHEVDLDNIGLRRLGRSPHLGRLTALELNDEVVSPANVREMLDAGGLAGLQRLTLRALRRGQHAAWAALGRRAALRRLRSLTLASTQLGGSRGESIINGAGLSALLAQDHLAGLEELNLFAQTLGDEGLRVLAAAHLPRLRRLVVRPGSAEAARALLRASKLPALEELGIDGANFADDSVAFALAKTPELARLRRLALFSGTDAGVRALAESPHAAGLERLELLANRLDSAGVAALAGSPNLPRLRDLGVGTIQFGAGPRDLIRLAESPARAGLARLRLSFGGHLTDSRREELRQRLGRRLLLEFPY
jgi:uncharacterized protein (TIGR02996 family)